MIGPEERQAVARDGIHEFQPMKNSSVGVEIVRGIRKKHRMAYVRHGEYGFIY